MAVRQGLTAISLSAVFPARCAGQETDGKTATLVAVCPNRLFPPCTCRANVEDGLPDKRAGNGRVYQHLYYIDPGGQYNTVLVDELVAAHDTASAAKLRGGINAAAANSRPGLFMWPPECGVPQLVAAQTFRQLCCRHVCRISAAHKKALIKNVY